MLAWLIIYLVCALIVGWYMVHNLSGSDRVSWITLLFAVFWTFTPVINGVMSIYIIVGSISERINND